MNIEDKKTALDDDAAIYQGLQSQESAKSERQKLSELSFKGKMRYLWDYYALKALIVLLVGALIGSMIYYIVRPRPETVAEFAVVDSPWLETGYENYSKRMLEKLGLNGKKSEVVFSYGYQSSNYTDGMSLTTHLFAGEIDSIIAPEASIRQYMENGLFITLDELPEDIREAARKCTTLSTDKVEEGEGVKEYVFSLKGTAFEQFMDPTGQSLVEMYIGFCSKVQPERKEALYTIVREMLGLPTPGAQ